MVGPIYSKNRALYAFMQNGMAERKNRTILDMARSMLKSKKLPKEFWAEAVACAVYLSNISPTRSVWGKTLQEAWSRRKPSISHLRVFRSIAHVHVPDEKRTKLDDKSESFIFIAMTQIRKATSCSIRTIRKL